MGIIILDLDNCISDDSWRISKIRWDLEGDDRYHDYHKHCADDGFCNKHLIDKRHKHVVITGRPSMYREITNDWLYKHGIKTSAMMMRMPGCTWPSVRLKEMYLMTLINTYGKNEIIAAYDDREDVVAMYKANGINACVYKIHNVCAYTNKITGDKE